MFKTFRYRIYPTSKQVTLINKHIGSTRFIYNLALETKQRAYASKQINLSCFDLIRQLPDLKKEVTWLNEVNSQSLQFPIRNLDNAFTKFFKGQANFPKFKKKSENGTFNIQQNVLLKNNKLIIPKFQEGINIFLHRPIDGVIKQATIRKTSTNKYFVSILCEINKPLPSKKIVKEKTTIGIDLGIKSFIVTSDGREFKNPKFFKEKLSKLRYVQKKFSRYKGKKTKYKLALLHEKIVNQRKDFLHKVSRQLLRENQSIAVENLQVSNIIKNHKLAQSIQDSGWRMFIDFIKYKADWYGVNVLQIGRFEPSSKTCSCCGNINKELTLQDREWICKTCGTLLDRDINAAINIKNFALRNHLSVGRRLKNRNELPTLVGVMTPETQYE